MASPIVGALLAFLGGTAVSALNYALNLRTLKKHPDRLAAMSIVRQTLNVAYLVAVFFLARVLPWDHVPLLVGAAVGLTLPAILLSLLLARQNDALNAKKDDNASPKGVDSNE